MQFKHPELLWGLLLLLIPIFIHLFQLRRFKKTPFTNVKFLKKVVSESRRSNNLKKWLLLLTRMLLLTALVIAFAQPFLAGKSALKEKETVIYLDDSFSMQGKSEGNTLLDNATQSLLKSLPKEQKFSLFTNDEIFKNVELAEVQNDLLALGHTPNQLQLGEVYLKANSLFSNDKTTLKNLIVISDFQQRFTAQVTDTTNSIEAHLVQLKPEHTNNVSLDSIYLRANAESPELVVLLSATGETESTPVSLFNGDQLIAKTAAVFNTDQKARVNFTLPQNTVIKGKLEINDTGLLYDNHLYFNLNKKKKIKVLAIGDENADFLKRIFTTDEFDFINTTTKNLDYSLLTEQNLIILNELPTIPNALVTSLKSFTDNGGKIVIIPSNTAEINSYNSFSNNYFGTSYLPKVNDRRNITLINFSHPLFQNVFEKKVKNFQYPMVSSFFPLKTNAPALLSFQDNEPFLVGSREAFFFTASLSNQNSNYKNSPLIVPTFYNMGKSSLKLPTLYQVLGQNVKIDIASKLTNDRVLRAVKDDFEFIPQQRLFSNRVQLDFNENPKDDGIYELREGEKGIQDISFNHDRKESQLIYLDPEQLNKNSVATSIDSLFESIKKENAVKELWKWFVILALFFMLVEILIQKYL